MRRNNNETECKHGPLDLAAILRSTTALTGLALTVALIAGSAQADEIWTGAVSNDWFDPANWADGSVPDGSDTVVLHQVSPVMAMIGPGVANATGLVVGAEDGEGLLRIHGGGDLLNGVGIIGILNRGSVEVQGVGSRWINSDLEIGDSSLGILTIANGGEVNSLDTFLGDAGMGQASVSDLASLWAITGDFTVGLRGSGELTIDSGGTVTSVDSRIGAQDGSLGTVTVTGAGSTWTNSGYLQVGEHGTGTLTIEADGDVTTDGHAAVGRDSGSVGTATVTGPGSTWTTNGFLTIGSLTGSKGSLTVADQGTVVSNSQVRLADAPGTQGTALVTGPGSRWIGPATQFHVGFGGEGLLTIADRGEVRSAFTSLGYRGSGFAAVMDGAAWTITDDFRIGEHGTGVLRIENGGTVNSIDSTIGVEADGAGAVRVTGGGSTWTNRILIVGRRGDGALAIEDGGTVNSLTASVGGLSGGRSVTTVGTGSTWNVTNSLGIGGQDTGILFIEDGGSVSSGQGTIAAGEGSIGWVVVRDAGSSWVNTGSLYVGVNGVGRLNIEDGSTVSNSNGFIGRGIRSTGVATVTGGSTWTNSGDLYVGDEGIGTLYIDAGAAVGAGGRVSVANQPGSSGLLVVDGTLAGTSGVDINPGGRLGGSGTVSGNTTVSGIVAPGNSIGTLHIVGPYTQVAGSTYEVEINAAGNSDLIDIAGMATLNGGTVEVLPFPDFALATPYTILTATGGVTGTFDAAAMGFSSAFLTPQLTYGTNDVTFAIAQTASFASAALTPNQEAAAEGADSLGVGNPVWDAIARLPSASEAPASFDAISGEVHASAASVLIEDSRFVREAVDARLRAAFAGVGADAAPVLAYGDDGPETSPADTYRFAAWGKAFGSWGEWDGDGNAASLNRDTGGFFLGGDMKVADLWRLGLLVGYSGSNFDIDDRTSSGSAESYHFGAYAGTEIGKWDLRFGGAYSWHDIDTARTASFPGFTDTLSAEYDAATAQVFAEAGYRIDTEHASFEPFANLAYVNLHTDGFTETGGSAALTAFSSSQDTTFTTLGLRAETALPLGSMAARLHGMLGWRHAFGDVTPTSDLAFAGGSAFRIAGVPIAEDAAIIEAGLDLALSSSANLGIAYNGQIGNGVSDHGLKAGLTMKF